MDIIDLSPRHLRAIEQAAQHLTENFAPVAWPTLDDALDEVHESLSSSHISRVSKMWGSILTRSTKNSAILSLG